MTTYELRDRSGYKVGELHERGPGYGDVYGASGSQPIGYFTSDSGISSSDAGLLAGVSIAGLLLGVAVVLICILVPVYLYWRVLRLTLEKFTQISMLMVVGGVVLTTIFSVISNTTGEDLTAWPIYLFILPALVLPIVNFTRWVYRQLTG